VLVKSTDSGLGCSPLVQIEMPVVKQEDPILAVSPSGFWRSSIAQLHIYQDRPAPTCAFLLALAIWMTAVCRLVWPDIANPIAASACLLRDVLLRPNPAEWRRYLLHCLWPLEPGYARGFLVSVALLLQGYAFEYEVGTLHFTCLLLGVQIASSVVLLYFRFMVCFISTEPALAALAVVMHRVNPKIHTDGLDKGIRVDFVVEPRWHVWMIESMLLLNASDFPTALAVHAVGYVIGAVCILRDPDAWNDCWNIFRERSPAVGRAVHIVLFFFVIVFMPLSALDFPSDALFAFLDGRALRLAWWRAAVPASSPLLHMALAGQLGTEALYLCRLLTAFALPLLLTPLIMWTRVYAVACVILLMYSMNSGDFRYPHVGYLVLLYLTWAFWKLPDLRPVVQKAE